MAYQSPMFMPALKVFCLVLAIVGIVMILISGSRAISGLDSLSWPHVPGRIVQSSAFPTGTAAGGFLYYKENIVYQYTLSFRGSGSRVFRGSGLSYKGFSDATKDSYSLEEANRLVKNYPVGRQVQVYYNPKKPDESTLSPGVNFGTFGGVLLGSLATLLGSLLLTRADTIMNRMKAFFERGV